MIRVHKPSDSHKYITGPYNHYGTMMFAYKDDYSWVMPTDEPAVDAYEVADTLRALQETLPLSAVGDYDVFCLDTNVMVGPTPDSGIAEAQATDGYLALSAGASWGLTDLLSHEFAHRFEEVLNEAEKAEFWRIVGQIPNYNAWDWAEDAKERFAEYFSSAVWGVPILNRDIPSLSTETLANIKTWALSKFGNDERVDVFVDVIKVQVGNPVVTVNDKSFTYDVAPMHIDPPGRVVVPLRLVAEVFGATVEWDEVTQTATIRR